MTALSGMSNQDLENLATLVLQRQAHQNNTILGTLASTNKQMREFEAEMKQQAQEEEPDDLTDSPFADSKPPELPARRNPPLGTNWQVLLNFTPV